MIYCGKTEFGQISRSLSLNSGAIGLKRPKNLTQIGFPSLPTVKSGRLLVFLLLLLLLAACATAKPAVDSFASAERAIEVAVQAGAEEHSPVELRFAREKLAEAYKGIEYKQYDKSVYLIDQSEINSELALEKTRAAIIRGKATDLARENEILREDFESTYGEEFK